MAETLFHHWPATALPARGRVLVVHGYGEHGGRHAEIAEALAGAGFFVWAGDLRGHGRAPGRRGHIEAWNDYLADLESWWQALPPEPEPFHLLGHSLGGLIALDWVLAHRERVRSLVLSSPVFELAFEPPAWRQRLARITTRILPALSQPSGIDPQGISSVAREVERYREDPLTHDRTTPRFYVSFRSAAARLQAIRGHLPCPTLVLFGEDDPIASIVAARAWVGKRRAEARMVTFPRGRHELFHEDFTIREAAIRAVVRFLCAVEPEVQR